MAKLGTVTVNVKIVGTGTGRIGLMVLRLVARIFKINLEAKIDKRG